MNRTARHALIGLRNLQDLVRAAIAERAGVVAEIMDVNGVLDALLEEYFYGGSFRDDFGTTLEPLGLSTMLVQHIRHSILTSLAVQVRQGFGEIWPGRQYSFQRLPNGDALITEIQPERLYHKPVTTGG